MIRKKCMACKNLPETEYPDYIDEAHLSTYTRALIKTGGEDYAESILSIYLIYCEMGKLCLCVECARKFLQAREDLIRKYGGE